MKNILKSGIVLLSLAAASSFQLQAQNLYDAAYLMQNEYFGTARSMALGNAMTAVGGDLGSVTLNPAGSAVSSYGQITITPALSTSISSTSLGSANNNTPRKLTMPNIGMTLNFDTGRSKGVTNIGFGVIFNQTAQYLSNSSASFSNATSSIAAERAFAASQAGYSEAVLGNYSSYESSNVPWDILVAYRGGLMGGYGYDGSYVGVTEGMSANQNGEYYFYIPGTLTQTSLIEREGSKNDLVLNLGFNVSDVFYFGLNLGLPSAHYSYSEYFFEAAQEPDLFGMVFTDEGGNPVDAYFSHLSTGYSLVTDMDGIYAKFGFIYRPLSGFLRLGAAIQTPALLTVSEMWQYSAGSYFTDSYFDLYDVSPTGEYSYQLRSPYTANLGAAIVLGSFGFVSMDYEYSDFGSMRFTDLHSDNFSDDLFRDINEASRLFAGGTHSFRFGLEVRPFRKLSFRLGTTTYRRVEHSWINNAGTEVYADAFINDFNYYNNNIYQLVSRNDHVSIRNSFSFGVGYSSEGSFFADFAMKFTDYPSREYTPYYDYYAGYGDEYRAAPRISVSRSLVTAALTLGWRF